MSDAEDDADKKPKSGGKKGLIIGLVLALMLGGGAFFAVFSGMVLEQAEKSVDEKLPLEETELATYVALDPMIISLGTRSEYQLRFSAQLEVEPSKSDAVANLTPRVLDVLNGYLRAIDVSELQDPTALIRLRAQMLRRIQLVTGTGHVRDLLITEFVFS